MVSNVIKFVILRSFSTREIDSKLLIDSVWDRLNGKNDPRCGYSRANLSIFNYPYQLLQPAILHIRFIYNHTLRGCTDSVITRVTQGIFKLRSKT